jgi:hypothetical protein
VKTYVASTCLPHPPSATYVFASNPPHDGAETTRRRGLSRDARAHDTRRQPYSPYLYLADTRRSPKHRDQNGKHTRNPWFYAKVSSRHSLRSISNGKWQRHVSRFLSCNIHGFAAFLPSPSRWMRTEKPLTRRSASTVTMPPNRPKRSGRRWRMFRPPPRNVAKGHCGRPCAAFSLPVHQAGNHHSTPSQVSS